MHHSSHWSSPSGKGSWWKQGAPSRVHRASSIEGISHPFHPFDFAWPMDHTNRHPPSMPPTVPIVLFSHFIAIVIVPAVIPAMITIRVRTSPHHSLPVNHHTLQAFYLRNPSKWEVTWANCQVCIVAGRTISSARRLQPWCWVWLQGGVGVHLWVRRCLGNWGCMSEHTQWCCKIVLCCKRTLCFNAWSWFWISLRCVALVCKEWLMRQEASAEREWEPRREKECILWRLRT